MSRRIFDLVISYINFNKQKFMTIWILINQSEIFIIIKQIK
jgi:hypothetical protein